MKSKSKVLTKKEILNLTKGDIIDLKMQIEDKLLSDRYKFVRAEGEAIFLEDEDSLSEETEFWFVAGYEDEATHFDARGDGSQTFVTTVDKEYEYAVAETAYNLSTNGGLVFNRGFSAGDEDNIMAIDCFEFNYKTAPEELGEDFIKEVATRIMWDQKAHPEHAGSEFDCSGYPFGSQIKLLTCDYIGRWVVTFKHSWSIDI